MNAQFNLQPAADPARDPVLESLKAAHLAMPGHKLVHLTHEVAGASCVLAIPTSSPWHELLPNWQIARVVPRTEVAA